MKPANCLSWMLALLAIAATAALAAGPDSAPAISAREANGIRALTRMNGVRLSDYRGFQNKWKLVTARYRTDKGEMRFTYANPKAYETLKAGRTDYPDGAVFAKIGIMTKEDPDFASSKVPSGAIRNQFMVHDSKKYAATHGWGYAIFSPLGEVMLQHIDEAAETAACNACHELVPHRGYVFSQLAPLTPPAADQPSRLGDAQASAAAVSRLVFSTLAVSKLPLSVRAHVPGSEDHVQMLEGELRKHTDFQGTFGELIPSLVQETIRVGKPSLIMSEDGKSFGLLTAEDEKTDPRPCPAGERHYVFAQTASFLLDAQPSNRTDKDALPIFTTPFCDRAR